MRERRNSARVLLHKSIEHDRKKKKEKTKKKKNKKPVANRTFTLVIRSVLLQKRTIDQEKS